MIKQTLKKLDYQLTCIDIRAKLKTKTPKLFLFGAPGHTNMGDQAQTFCSIGWFQKNYPAYEVIVLDSGVLPRGNYGLLKIVRAYIKPDDKIFLHSGYHTTDLYINEDILQQKIVTLFPDFKIVILPQTIFYQSKTEQNKAKQIYNAHPNLFMLCRDELSYQTAQEIFPKCHPMLFPDIVTTMIGTKRYPYNRSGILLCLRNDKEAYLTPDDVEVLTEQLEKLDSVTITDTTIPLKLRYVVKHREQVINQVLDEYAHYKLIITDRYHGTIYSLISNTPVLVLPSTDHKLSSGVKWFPEAFSEYVQYAGTRSETYTYAEKMYHQPVTYALPEYFNTHYYDKLKGLIEKG